MSSTPPPTIGVIGCGAIAEMAHIPAFARHDDVRERMILIDRDEARAKRVAGKFGVGRTATDYKDVIDDLDGAVVAVPHHLHVPITLDLVGAGIHVLCEKPLAETPEDVDRIVEAARENGVTVGVNNKRRLYPANGLVRDIVASGEIGAPKRLEYVQGFAFDWPAATPSYFGPKAGCKGVFYDLGSHVVDLACWWLGGRVNVLSFTDDARGGTEAVAELRFEKDGCEGLVRLSWLTSYSNSFRVIGDKGSVSGELFEERAVTVTDSRGNTSVRRSEDKRDSIEAMADSLIHAIKTGDEQAVPAHAVRDSIDVIQECYGKRQLFEDDFWYADACAGVVR